VGDFEANKGIERYMEALKLELNHYETVLAQSKIMTIYIGGGTPSAIDGALIHELIAYIRKIADVDKHVEITIEINPGTLTMEKLNHYLSAGINRVSMGLQTTNDSLLTALGRIHSTNDFITTFNAVKMAGIDNISLDLMFGLPNQTLQDIENALALIRTLKPTHVSAYSLKIEEGTPLYESYESGNVILPDEDLERDMYHEIENGLLALGIEEYELSNFSSPGYESKHNLVYWKNEPYLGIGVSSHSKLSNTRFSNTSLIHRYMSSLEAGNLPIEETDAIDKNEDLFESIILGLRLNRGINMSDFSEKYEIDFLAKYKDVLESLLDSSLIHIKEDNVILTEKGRDLANQVFLQFMVD
jgi:oxygen-independent coproporphyrinogen-3 oxidase